MTKSSGRRTVVKLLPAAAIAAVGGYLGFEYAPWLNCEEQGNRSRQPMERSTATPVQMREIIRYSTLAANAHNAQPWRFAVGTDAIEIHPDFDRRLPVVDPVDRELWISLGCALENLMIAARVTGYRSEITYPNDADDFIRAEFTHDTPETGILFKAIPFRQNTRSEYNGRPIESGSLDKLRALVLEPGVALHFVLGSSGLNTVRDYVAQGNLMQYSDARFVKKLIQWLRFNNREAFHSLDGLALHASGRMAVPRWLGKMAVTGGKPQSEANADSKALLSSSGAVVVTSAEDNKALWVRTGQVYQRLALAMTSLEIRSAFLNQPIEVAGIREQFRSAMNLGQAQPQLLVRFGYAPMMPRSLRRPPEQVTLMQSLHSRLKTRRPNQD